MARRTNGPHRIEQILPTARGFQAAAPLSVHRAFVVHFGPGGGPRRRRFRGRVEHLASGRTARFSSLERLLGFVTTTLDGADPGLAAALSSGRRGSLA